MQFIKVWIMALALVMTPMIASAGKLVAKVDVSQQIMTVIYNGKVAYRWDVSTARKGKITPRGTYTAKWLSKNHKSSLYNDAPMPHAIFYSGHYAIHGTNQISRLGRPASAGCVRLHPKHAATLFRLVQKVGLRNMKVQIRN